VSTTHPYAPSLRLWAIRVWERSGRSRHPAMTRGPINDWCLLTSAVVTIRARDRPAWRPPAPHSGRDPRGGIREGSSCPPPLGAGARLASPGHARYLIAVGRMVKPAVAPRILLVEAM
jgi:hypothetical protein